MRFLTLNDLVEQLAQTILGQALSVVVLERLRSHQLMGQVL